MPPVAAFTGFSLRLAGGWLRLAVYCCLLLLAADCCLLRAVFRLLLASDCFVAALYLLCWLVRAAGYLLLLAADCCLLLLAAYFRWLLNTFAESWRKR